MRQLKQIIIIFILTVILSCSDDGAGPKDTIDTTSHDFTFRLDTLGEYSSILNDVAIIDNDNIWAVGQIFVVDSSGNEQKYNAAVWNGQEWGLKQVQFRSSLGSLTVGEISCIFSFNDRDIWMFSYWGAYAHWNGQNWVSEVMTERQGSIKKMWGSAPDNLYAVGTNGSISHYNGSIWSKLESNTNIDIQDIWGDQNPDTGEWEILVLASNPSFPVGLALLNINDDTYSVDTTSTMGLRVLERGLWFESQKAYYISGDGLYKKEKLKEDQTWQRINSLPNYYKRAIRGTNTNNLFVVGDFGLFAHYNGSSWKSSFAGFPSYILGNWYSVSASEKIVCGVGALNGDRAITFIGNNIQN